MIANARYGHTNLIARDWRALASFYESVFGCVVVPPERNFSGPDLEAGTGIAPRCKRQQAAHEPPRIVVLEAHCRDVPRAANGRDGGNGPVFG